MLFNFSGVSVSSNLVKLSLITSFDLKNGPNVFPSKHPTSDDILYPNNLNSRNRIINI